MIKSEGMNTSSFFVWEDGESIVTCVDQDTKKWWECPRGVMVKAMDCKIVVSEVELRSCYYVHFRTNTFG